MPAIKLNPYLILLGLAGLIITGMGCHLLAPYEPASATVAQHQYRCGSQIYRTLGDGTHEFTELWGAYVYSDSTDVQQLCLDKQAEYIAKSMSPHFNWQTQPMVLLNLPDRPSATDCTFEPPFTEPRGPEEEPPATYGAPAGSVLTWAGVGDQPVSSDKAFVELRLTDADGNVHVATPGVKTARLEFAERQGALDAPLHEAVYDPAKRHIRVSDFFIELVAPFDLGDVSVKSLYVQSIGTILSQSHVGNSQYPVSTDPGKSKFYFRAVGEADGETATDSRCFVNKQVGTNFRVYSGPPNPFFSMVLSAPMLGGQPLDLELRLIMPADGTLFGTHQPHVQVFNRDTSETEVDLALGVQEVGPDGVIFDHDGAADLSGPVLWFEDFEQPGERFLGEGQSLTAVPFSPGSHEITVVAYDAKGSYNYDTGVVNVAVPPVANDDAYATDEDVVLNVSAPGVLSNDTDGNNDPLTAVLNTDPSHGTVDLSADGSFAYTPEPDFNGTDSFTYKANDGSQDSDPATVTITVNPVNDAPVANDDAYSTDEDILLVVAAPGVLDNDSDVDGDPLTAVPASPPSNGSLTLNADGSFSYVPNPNFFGADSFTYVANDGTEDSGSATVAITVNERSTQDELDDISQDVDDLLAEGVLNGGQANSLLTKLDDVLKQFDKGKTATACNQLQAYINHVTALLADGILTAAQAQGLIDKANNLGAELGC